MKVLKVSSIVVLLLIVIAIVGVVIFLARFDVNVYLTPIKQQASSALGRDVDIDHAKLDLNFIRGVSLAINGVSIADDPSFSKGKFLTIEHVNAGVDIAALLFKKQIIITRLSIDGVNVHLIKNGEGLLNAPVPPSLASTKELSIEEQYQARLKPVIFSNQDPTMSGKPDTSKLPNLIVNSIDIRHLTVHFEDKTPAFPIDFMASDIQIIIKDLSLVNPFNVLINGALFSDQQNLSVAFTVALDVFTQSATLTNFNVTLPVESIQLDKVKALSPNLATISFPDRIKGNLKIATESVKVSAKGLDGLSLTIKLDDGLIKFSELPAALTDVVFEIGYATDALDIKSFNATIGSNGKISLKGGVGGLSRTLTYNGILDAKNLELKDLVAESKMPVVVKSALDIQSTFSGVSLAPTEALINLNGNLSVNVMEGKIEKFNIVNQMVDKLKDVAIVGPVVSEMFKNGVDGYIDTNVTQLNNAVLMVNVANGLANIESFKINTPQVIIEGKGKVLLPSFETAILVDTRLSPDVSAQLVNKIESLKGLQESNGVIYFPGTVSGVIPSITYKADVAYIAKKVATNETANALGQQLDKVIEKNPEVRNILNSVLGSNQGKNQNQSTSQPQSSGEDMINNLLKKVIK